MALEVNWSVLHHLVNTSKEKGLVGGLTSVFVAVVCLKKANKKKRKSYRYATPGTCQRSISNSFKVGPMEFVGVVIVFVVGVGGSCNFQHLGPRVRFNAETNQVNRNEEQTCAKTVPWRFRGGGGKLKERFGMLWNRSMNRSTALMHMGLGIPFAAFRELSAGTKYIQRISNIRFEITNLGVARAYRLWRSELSSAGYILTRLVWVMRRQSD